MAADLLLLELLDKLIDNLPRGHLSQQGERAWLVVGGFRGARSAPARPRPCPRPAPAVGRRVRAEAPSAAARPHPLLSACPRACADFPPEHAPRPLRSALAWLSPLHVPEAPGKHSAVRLTLSERLPGRPPAGASLTSACRSTMTASAWPLRPAAYRGISPLASEALVSAPCLASISTSTACPRTAA